MLVSRVWPCWRCKAFSGLVAVLVSTCTEKRRSGPLVALLVGVLLCDVAQRGHTY